MNAVDIVAIISVSLGGFVAMTGLLGWIVRILSVIQTDLARLAVEVSNLANRMDRVERREDAAPEGGRVRT
ncbi:MAG: hypothetical protein H6813_02605 [Phycisphaeraceae bacterium]|nr:hypothetical protein [Phycisphaeraceae bacterium]MCB9848793.1 hypothetical protein [Phycisphaeraceae bacterium]